MVISIGIIVLALVTQNSLQEYVNPRCHPDLNRGILCHRKEDVDTSENWEKLRFGHPEAFLNYPEKTHKSSRVEDAVVQYESIQNAPDKHDNSQGKLRTPYFRNFEDQNDEFYSDDGLRFGSFENRKDVSVAMDKFENEDEINYKSIESLRNFPEFADISDSESEFEPYKHLRNTRNQNKDSIKYENYEKIKHQLEKGKWIISKPKLEKRFLGGLFAFGGRIGLEIGVGMLIDKIFN